MRSEQKKTLIEQQNAESAYRRERQRALEAEERFRLARRAVDELIQVSEEELAHRQGTEGLRKRLLASALAYYQEFIDQRRGDPDAQAELRDTTKRVETILADLAILRAAGELYLLLQPPAFDDLRLDDGQRRQGGRALRPRRQALDGDFRRPRPGWSLPPSEFVLPSSRPAPTRPRSTRSSRHRNACAFGSSPCNQRGWVPSVSQRLWPDSDSRPANANRSARSRNRS